MKTDHAYIYMPGHGEKCMLHVVLTQPQKKNKKASMLHLVTANKSSQSQRGQRLAACIQPLSILKKEKSFSYRKENMRCPN